MDGLDITYVGLSHECDFQSVVESTSTVWLKVIANRESLHSKIASHCAMLTSQQMKLRYLIPPQYVNGTNIDEHFLSEDSPLDDFYVAENVFRPTPKNGESFIIIAPLMNEIYYFRDRVSIETLVNIDPFGCHLGYHNYSAEKIIQYTVAISLSSQRLLDQLINDFKSTGLATIYYETSTHWILQYGIYQIHLRLNSESSHGSDFQLHESVFDGDFGIIYTGLFDLIELLARKYA